jgi:DNA polymerase-3 subunit alpha
MSEKDSFVHLHVHSEFSLLDGAARIEAPSYRPDAPTILSEAARMRMPAIAVTDHGAMFSALRFVEAAGASGVRPIVGVEAYVAPGSRFDRAPGDNEEKYHHLTLLASDETGYRNLLKLVTAASLEGFYHRPRMDKDLLAELSQGLICLSGCLSSEISLLLLAGQERRALETASHYRDIFEGSYYVEVQDHGLSDQSRVLPAQIELAKRLGVPLVATNDLHYTRREDAKPHDVLLCIQQQKLQTDSKRLRFDSEEFYLKSPQEMRTLFSEVPEACDATLEIASRCELDLVYGDRAPADQRYHLPRFETPEGASLEGYLRELVTRGAHERYGTPIPDEVEGRIAHELGVIGAMGFAGYFLIVWDLIRFARDSGIRVGPGRGSAAGSVVSYCLRITDLDPLRYGLIFERFLNPERRQMPDIDMDFDERRRDEVIRYASDRYGSDRVAQIITFQTIKGKQGIRDAARVLGFRPSFGDRLCKMYPPAVMGRDEPIEKALVISPELHSAYENEPEAREIIDNARALEGLRREDSVHAAGVVIGDAPLVNYLPLKLAKDSRDDAKRIVTQFDMHGVEQLGLLKMDFLGLRTLSVIDDTVRHLRERGLAVDIDQIDLSDEPTYRMLCMADTTGVFQMESPGMRTLIRNLAPDRFEDMMALVALYRPGPMNAGMHIEYAERKHGRRPVSYPHADVEDILQTTYGVMVYQEQIMQIAVRLAGYSPGQADDLRRVMAKKKRELIGKEREKFVEGCLQSGYPRRLAETLFDQIEPFADYGFPAAHACAYGYVAYQTAYLKAHHPVEYMSAILTSVKDDKDRKPFYLYTCRGMGLAVLPPDINDSQMDFTPVWELERGAIRYGLSAVRNVGEGVVEQILAARGSKGRFASLADLCRKVDPSVLSKRVLESLILAGSFDSLGYPRRSLLEGYERVTSSIIADRRAEAAGMVSLFQGQEDDLDSEVDRRDQELHAGPEFDKRTLLRFEKEMLGQYVTDHPLLEVQEELSALSTHRIEDLPSLGDGDLVTVGGIIGSVSRRFTRNGEPYAELRLEGLAGGIDVVAFPSVVAADPDLISTDRIVVVTGRIDLRRGVQIRANEVRDAPVASNTSSRNLEALVIDLPPAACTHAVLSRMKDLFQAYPGRAPVRVRFMSATGVTPLDLGDFRVDPTRVIDEVRMLLGNGSARVERELEPA